MLPKQRSSKKRSIENITGEFSISQNQFYLKVDSHNTSPVVWVELNGILKKLEHLKVQKKQELDTNTKSKKALYITLYYE